MRAIYKKEMRTYFTQMSGYVFLSFLVMFVAVWYILGNLMDLDSNFHLTLTNVIIFFFVLLPVITTRLFSEEIRQKTDQLIFTSPLTVPGIVVGKFLAALTLFLIATALTLVMPFMIRNHGNLPVSQIAGTYIGFVLLGASCIAIGVFISCLSESQIIVAIGTMAAIFVMFLMDAIAMAMPTSAFSSFMFVAFIIAAFTAIWYNATKNKIATGIMGAAAIAFALGLYFYNNLIYDGVIIRVLHWFSLFSRFHNFTRGILNLADVVYYVSFSVLLVYLTINVIEKRRWR